VILINVVFFAWNSDEFLLQVAPVLRATVTTFDIPTVLLTVPFDVNIEETSFICSERPGGENTS
jgi:hypothetical protein